MPRLYRESPLNAIWEGSGNVIALDVLRAANRSPASLETFFAELDSARGADDRLDDAIRRVKSAMVQTTDLEFEARRVVETFAVTWAAALLVRHGDDDVASSFLASRITERHGGLYGALPTGTSVSRLMELATPDP